MARLFSSGFELQSVTDGVEWDTNTGNVTISTSTVRSGAAALRANNTLTSEDEASVKINFLSAGGTNDIYYRFYLRIATAPNSLTTIMSTRDTAAGINNGGIRLNANRTLELWDINSSVQRGSDSAALDLNTWYRIEMRFDATNDDVYGYIDGVQFATGDVAAGADNPNQVTIGSTSLNRSFDLFYDDVAVNDSTGSFENSLPGVESIIHLKPNAAGDNTNWTPTATNWSDVDETTPNDATDNVRAAIATNIDDYNLEATPAAVGASDTIKVVQVGHRYMTDSAAQPSGHKLRIKASSGGTVEESAEITPNSTSWKTNANAAPISHALTLYDQPGASTTPWSKATLDTAQVGLNLTTSSAGSFANRVSTIWVLVGFAPPPSGDPTVNKSENITVTESVGRMVQSFASKSDTITLTESSNAALAHQIKVSDSVTITESVGRLLTSSVNKSDTVTITESVTVQVPSMPISVSDTVTITENVALSVGLLADRSLSVSDSITVAESVRADLVLFVSTSDSITITESFAKLLQSFISKSDSITLTESTNQTLVSLVSQSDSITLSELVARLETSFINKSENITVSESPLVLLPSGTELNIAVNESISLSESVSASVQAPATFSINVSDSITVTENIGRTLVFNAHIEPGIQKTTGIQVV